MRAFSTRQKETRGFISTMDLRGTSGLQLGKRRLGSSIFGPCDHAIQATGCRLVTDQAILWVRFDPWPPKSLGMVGRTRGDSDVQG